MVSCATCHKVLPPADRFCAYCGTRQPFRWPWAARRGLPAGLGWVRGQPLPRTWITGGLGAALGAGLGAAVGLALGSLWLMGVFGALGLGAAAALADLTAGAIPDRATAQRFGLAWGLTAGLLALPLGVLVLAVVVMADQGLAGLAFVRGLMQVKFSYGVLGTLIATAVGLAVGAAGGYYAGQGGYALGRRGALLGAALAWVVAAGLAGLIAGDYAAQIIGLDRLPAARLGLGVEIVVGALLLAGLRPALARLKWWWGRRP
ncbi:MAG: zinc ribbon domain-containing protein [Anaerolineales bacterium]|nr:zinc ribbon domain-containing protein [Anaerolineales bacterium]